MARIVGAMITLPMRWVTMGVTGEMWAALLRHELAPWILLDPYHRGRAPTYTLDNSVGKHDPYLFLAAGAGAGALARHRCSCSVPASTGRYVLGPWLRLPAPWSTAHTGRPALGPTVYALRAVHPADIGHHRPANSMIRGQ